MSDKPVFIEYDVEAEKAELKGYFEELTGKKLFPAQLENIMLNVISYKASLLVQKFNEAALLNLPQFSRYPVLDFIGELFNCYRLKAQKGIDILKIELYESMSFDFTISKGLQVLTKDEKYIFETVSDVVIKAGDLFAYVEIQSVDANSDVNNYGAGEINILIKPESYIKSVSNMNGVAGGFDEEDDESYIKRILLAPEGFSCAGSKNAYIYHTLATHAGILDAQADSPQIPATIENDGNIYSEFDNTIVGNNFNAQIDYKTGTCILKIGETEYKIVIPPQSTVFIYPLTADDETPQSILDMVDKKFNGEDINPMCDRVIVLTPAKKTINITLNIILKADADYNSSVEKIMTAANNYKSTIRKKLNAEIVPSHITTLIGNIEEVYSVDCDNFNISKAKVNEFFDINYQFNIKQRI